MQEKFCTLSDELLETLKTLPQISSKEWSESQLVEYVLRNWLQMPSDYDQTDLEIVRSGGIVE